MSKENIIQEKVMFEGKVANLSYTEETEQKLKEAYEHPLQPLTGPISQDEIKDWKNVSKELEHINPEEVKARLHVELRKENINEPYYYSDENYPLQTKPNRTFYQKFKKWIGI